MPVSPADLPREALGRISSGHRRLRRVETAERLRVVSEQIMNAVAVPWSLSGDRDETIRVGSSRRSAPFKRGLLRAWHGAQRRHDPSHAEPDCPPLAQPTACAVEVHIAVSRVHPVPDRVRPARRRTRCRTRSGSSKQWLERNPEQRGELAVVRVLPAGGERGAPLATHRIRVFFRYMAATLTLPSGPRACGGRVRLPRPAQVGGKTLRSSATTPTPTIRSPRSRRACGRSRSRSAAVRTCASDGRCHSEDAWLDRGSGFAPRCAHSAAATSSTGGACASIRRARRGFRGATARERLRHVPE